MNNPLSPIERERRRVKKAIKELNRRHTDHSPSGTGSEPDYRQMAHDKLKATSHYVEKVTDDLFPTTHDSSDREDPLKPELNYVARIINSRFLNSDYQGKDWESVRLALIEELSADREVAVLEGRIAEARLGLALSGKYEHRKHFRGRIDTLTAELKALKQKEMK